MEDEDYALRAGWLRSARDAAASVDFLFAHPERSPVAVVKGDKDFATEADMEAHRLLCRALSQATPQIPVLSEEASEQERLAIAQQKAYWVVDPIDGTINFAAGSPLCGVAIALIEDGQAQLGVLRFARLGEEYWAQLGRGAFFNGRRLRLPALEEQDEPANSIVCHGALPSPEGAITQRELAEAFLSTQSIGSAALALAWSAKGMYGACLFRSNNAWDMQAGCLLVKEAGGVARDWRGQAHDVSSKTMLAGSERSVEAVSSLFARNAQAAAASQARRSAGPRGG